MHKSIWDVRIPSLLGITLLLAGLWATTYFVQNTTKVQTQAVSSSVPLDIKIANLSENEFTVTYRTNAKVSGSIFYGTTPALGLTVFDDRNSAVETTARNTHHITLKNLTALTNYYFLIISGDQTYYNNSLPFEVTTASALNQTPSAVTLNGRVLAEDGTPSDDAIISITTPNSQLFSTVTDSDGNYTSRLEKLRTADLSSYFSSWQNARFEVAALSQNAKAKARVIIDTSKTLPTITLSHSYDFTLTPPGVPTASFQSRFPSFQKSPSKKSQ